MTRLRIAALLSCLPLAACEFDVPDLNRPSLDQILSNPNPSAVDQAATGLLAGARADITQRIGYVSELGILGREALVLTGSDDRFVTLLLNSPSLDGSTPNFGGNFWVAPYANLRNADLVLKAVDKVPTVPASGPAGFTDGEKSAIKGFTKTIMALALLEVINTRDVNGAAADISRNIDGVDSPLGQFAPIVGKDAVFTKIASLLDDAKTDLTAAVAANASFPFPLANGFAGFNTPAQFLTANRALMARVQVYRGQFSSALQALSESFLDSTAPLSTGIYHSYGLGSGDQTNDLNTSEIRVHPLTVSEAETLPNAPASCASATPPLPLNCLDLRVQAKVATAAPTTILMETSGYVFTIYPNKDSPIPIIRNEELILLRAEANIGLNNLGLGTPAAPGALGDINFIRQNSGGLNPVGPFASQAAALDELLKQKRYSLLFEGGHRWIDARRYAKPLPIDQPGVQYVILNFPIPTAETDARH